MGITCRRKRVGRTYFGALRTMPLRLIDYVYNFLISRQAQSLLGWGLGRLGLK